MNMGYSESTHKQSMMVDSNRNSNSTCNSGAADAIEGGDLTHWDYLTETFDHDDIFQERAQKKSYDDINSTTLSTLMADHAVTASVVAGLPQTTLSPSPFATAASMESHFISTNVVVNTTYQGHMFLPPQNIRYELPGSDEPITLALEPTPLSSMTASSQQLQQSQPLSLPSMGFMYEYTSDAHRPTTPLDFGLEPLPCEGILSATTSEPFMELFATNQAPAWSSETDDFPHSELVGGGSGGLVRASSCIIGSTFPTDEPFRDFLSSMANATLPSSFSCPTLPSAGTNKKRACPDSFASGRRYTTSQVNYSPHDDIAVGVTKMPPTTMDALSNKRIKFCKPLKVYNYYYRDERDNIVHGMKQHGDPLPPPVNDFTQAKFEQLLHHRWYVDPIKERRVHRKQHGKIEFSTLSQVISGRWRSLPEHGRDFYRRVARADQEHYDQYMATSASSESQSAPHESGDHSTGATTAYEC